MKKENEKLPAALSGEPDAEGLQAVWDILGRAAEDDTSMTPADTDEAWGALRRRLESRGSLPVETGSDEDDDVVSLAAARRRGLGVPAVALRRAAAVVALAVGGTLAWYSVPVQHTAPAGERLAVTLPDGSVAELNAGSTLEHRRGFAWLPGLRASSRAVDLSGEAFFDVTTGERPFEVTAGPAHVRVLGTRFDVRARGGSLADATAVDVLVQEGRVAVWGDAAGPGSEVVLGSGEAVRYDAVDADYEVRSVRPERIGAWRTGGLTLVDETLEAVAVELSLMLDVHIEVADASARQRRVSVYYPAVDSLESVLGDLATQQGLRVRRTSVGWELF